jgi:hypothetical protein
MQSADLHLLQPGVVNAAYKGANKELRLFYLFLSQNYLDTVCRWTNEVLQWKGKIFVVSNNFMVTWVLRWEFQSSVTIKSKSIGQRVPFLVIPHLVRKCLGIGFRIFVG